jgi:hypothetical protein
VGCLGIYNAGMKDTAFLMRLSVEEREQLRSAARLAGMPLSQFLLSKALPPIPAGDCPDCERLARVGGGKCPRCEGQK